VKAKYMGIKTHLTISFAWISICGNGTTFQGRPTKDRLGARAGGKMDLNSGCKKARNSFTKWYQHRPNRRGLLKWKGNMELNCGIWTQSGQKKRKTRRMTVEMNKKQCNWISHRLTCLLGKHLHTWPITAHFPCSDQPPPLAESQTPLYQKF